MSGIVSGAGEYTKQLDSEEIDQSTIQVRLCTAQAPRVVYDLQVNLVSIIRKIMKYKIFACAFHTLVTQ